MKITDLAERVKQLPPEDQVTLVEAILDNLDLPDSALDLAWKREAEDRLAAHRRGEIRAIPILEVLTKYQDR